MLSVFITYFCFCKRVVLFVSPFAFHQISPLGFDRVLKEYILPCESFIDSTKCFELGFGGGLLLRIEVSLEDLGSISTKSCSLSNNLCWVAHVTKHGFVNGGQGSAAWSSERVSTFWWLHDLSVSYNDDMLSAKLLLQLANKSFLNLLETLAKSEWHVNDHSLATTRNVNLLSRHNVQVSQVSFKFSTCRFEVEKSLSNTLFKAIRGNTL